MNKNQIKGSRVFVLVQGVQGLKNHQMDIEGEKFRVTVFDPKTHWAVGNKATALAKKSSDNEVALFIGDRQYVNAYREVLEKKFPGIKIHEWKGDVFTASDLQRITSECLMAVEA